jgi:kojibiose phosphorylase
VKSDAARDAFALEPDPRWRIDIEGWNPEREPAIEAICALVNGYCGVRAAVEEGSAASNPATFLNGVFDAAHELVAQASATPEHQVIAAPTSELVKVPDWSRVRLWADGTPLQLDTTELLEHSRTLELRRGALVRSWRFRLGSRTTRVRSLRFASLDDRHLLGQILEITPEDWAGEIRLEAVVDADVTNEGDARHLVQTESRRDGDRLLLSTRTSENAIAVCMAASATLIDDAGARVEATEHCAEQSVSHAWTFRARPGQTFTCEKLVSVFTSRDGATPAASAMERLDRAAPIGVLGLHERSARAWSERWATADVGVDGDATIQRQVRFASYHLIGCANPDDEHASPGARSLTGERYKGHVFWDTEIFVLPFFVFTHPPTARALLMYRYHTLPAARDRARAQGYRGALYAWESTDTGIDLTPPFVINAAGERLQILTGEQEHHISADVGFAICQYRDATQDRQFLLDAGAEMLFEIAAFWASRAVPGEDGRFHIRGVIGPDEYHESVDDNAYTNRMARYVLRRAVGAARWLQAEEPRRWEALSRELDLQDEGVVAWAEVADKLVDNSDGPDGVIEQHAGYFDLEPADLARYEPRTQTMDVVLGWDALVGTQVLKQADVLMLAALLDHEASPAVWEANYRFYEPRTSHDSSLSASMHALVAARLGLLVDAERYVRKAASIDFDLTQGVTAAGGVHIAALGGIWQALVFGFLGIETNGRELRANGQVPKGWGRVRARLLWRGAEHAVLADEQG